MKKIKKMPKAKKGKVKAFNPKKLTVTDSKKMKTLAKKVMRTMKRDVKVLEKAENRAIKAGMDTIRGKKGRKVSTMTADGVGIQLQSHAQKAKRIKEIEKAVGTHRWSDGNSDTSYCRDCKMHRKAKDIYPCPRAQ